MRFLKLLVATCIFATTTSAAELGKLTIRVTDAETNALLPARLVLRSSDGTYPGDRIACTAAKWPNLEMHGVFITGEHTFELPAEIQRSRRHVDWSMSQSVEKLPLKAGS